MASDYDLVSAGKGKDPFGAWHLQLTIRVDELTINTIVVNRNNCQILSVSKRIGVPMKFGDRIDVVTVCDPIEVSIESDLGRRTFNWD